MAAVMAFGNGQVAAQDSERPTTVRLSVQSDFETIGATADSGSLAESISRFAVDFSHRHETRRGTLRIWSGVTADQFWNQSTAPTLAAATTLDDTTTLTRRLQLSVSDRASSAPLDVFAVLGAAVPATVSRSVVSGQELQYTRTFDNDLDATLRRTLDSRTVLAVSGTGTFSETFGSRVTSAGAGGALTRRVNPFALLHFGYKFSEIHTRDSAQTLDQRRHDIDIGVDYARPVPMWRHTTVAVSTGSTVLADNLERHLHVNVAARVEHRFNLRWTTTADYSRPIEYVAGLVQPLVSDSFRAGVTGTLARDVEISAIGGVASGTVGLTTAQRYDSHTATVRLSRWVGQELQLAIELHEGAYNFNGALPGGVLPDVFARSGIRAGIVWAPGNRLPRIDEPKKGVPGAARP